MIKSGVSQGKEDDPKNTTDTRVDTLEPNAFEDKEIYDLLYRKSTPAILHSIIINKHRDLLL